MISLLGCKKEDIICVSAKTGVNVESVLDAVIERVPEPKGLNSQSELVLHEDPNFDRSSVKALIFDSQYDSYKGVVVYVKLFSGRIQKGDSLEFIHTGSKIEALEVGCFSPKWNPIGVIEEGEIGYIVTGLKTIADARVGDTVFRGSVETKNPIRGFKRITPFIFAGVYPVDTDEYPKLKDSMDKLMLNDSSLVIENEVSPALGHGFRCGFLGLLHLDIVKERLWREFDMDVIMTSPQVTYRVMVPGDKAGLYPRNSPEITEYQGKQSTAIMVSNPEDLPAPGNFLAIEEPIAKIEIITPTEYVGNLMQLSQERRGIFKNQYFLDARRTVLVYEIPLAELVGDFYDDLKSLSS